MLELYLLALVIGGIAAVVGPMKVRAAMKRRIQAGSFTLTHDTAVTVVGVIRPSKQEVVSPLTGRRGIYIYAEAELPEPGPDFERLKLRTILMAPFELDTQHGVILVDGTTADTTMKAGPIRPRWPDKERAFVTSHGRGEAVAQAAIFRELVIESGARVAVNGIAKVEELPLAERGYRDAVPTRVRLVAPEQHRITIGKPGDRY
jgi:hypothetical protein